MADDARKGMILIMSGPSGSGKSSIYKKAFTRIDNFAFSVSCTTRAPREGEKDGIDYHFIGKEEFRRLIDEDAFAEHAEVHGNFYGTLKSELTDRTEKGVDVLLDIDVQGAAQLRELCGKDKDFADACEFVFIAPPSLEILEKRLRGRGTETEEAIEKRLGNSKGELAHWKDYSFVIVNDDLDAAAEKLVAFINTFRSAVKRYRKEPFDE